MRLNFRLIAIVVLILVSIFPLVTAYRYPIGLNDDAFITLTYSKNLAGGNGFVYNHPPAVLGTTTPLLALAIAALAIILPAVGIPHVVVFFSALCWMGILWGFFIFRRVWKLSEWQVCILALVLAGAGWVGSLEMEGYLFAFLLVLSLSFFLDQRYFWAGLLSGLLFLTRGEGALIPVLLSGILIIRLWLEKRPFQITWFHRPLKLWLGFAAIILPWAIYATFTFGSILPNTLAAKQVQGQTGIWRSFFQRLVYDWAPSWGLPFKLGPINFWWLIILVGTVVVFTRKRTWLILLGWIALYIAGYTALNVSGYTWYQLPILFVLSILFALGIIALIELLHKLIKPKFPYILISLAFASSLVFFLAKSTVQAALNNPGDPRSGSYMALGRWFIQHADPSQSIAFIEVGYLGYFTDNRIVDLAGLTAPAALAHIKNGDFAWSFWQAQPDYYVYLPDFDWALSGIRADPRFDILYRPAASLPGPRLTDFTIYERVGK